MKRIVTTTHETKVAQQNYITNFDIRKLDGENVIVAAKRLKAIVKSLNPADLPTNMITCVLRGMEKASNAEFTQLCNSEVALSHSPIYIRALGNLSRVDHLFMVLDSLVTKYCELCTADDWSSVGHQGSSFNATQAKGGAASRLKSDGSRRSDTWLPRSDFMSKAKCHHCGEVGHIRPNCPKRNEPPIQSTTSNPRCKYSINKRDVKKFSKLANYVADLNAFFTAATADGDDSDDQDDDDSSADDGKMVNLASEGDVDDDDSTGEDENTFHAHAAMLLNNLSLGN